MKFFVFVLGLVVNTRGITKVDSLRVAQYDYNDYENNKGLRQEDEGKEISQYWMTTRDEMLSIATRDL